MEERGLSDVITTVLIILLSLIAIGIVYVVVSNIIKSSSEKVDLGTFTAQVDVVPGSVKALKAGTSVYLSFLIKRGGEGEDLSGVNVVVEDDSGVSRTFKEDYTTEKIKAYETKKITGTLFGFAGNIAKVTVVPIITKEGKEMEGSQKSIYKIQPGELFAFPDGLVGYWSFDSESNGKIPAFVGDYEGTKVGSPTINSNQKVRGSSLQVSTGNYVNFGNKVTDLLEEKAFTVIFWFKYTSDTMGPYVGPISGNQVSNGFMIRKDLNGNNLQYITFWPSSILEHSTPLVKDKWYFVTVTSQGTGPGMDSFYLFESGTSFVNPLTLDLSPVPKGTDSLYVGRAAGLNYDLNGNVDELMIYNRVLTQSEIQQVYNYIITP